ncbi:MAG: hypothetical protein J6W05_01405 [Prevotella sp.]|nr:hypothetical protein [Prevotella sp.]
MVSFCQTFPKSSTISVFVCVMDTLKVILGHKLCIKGRGKWYVFEYSYDAEANC